MFKVDTQKIAIVVLAILLIIAISYICGVKYREYKTQQTEEILKQGAQQGYEYAIMQIMQQASSCEPVPLYANNVTMNIIALECSKIPINSTK